MFSYIVDCRLIAECGFVFSADVNAVDNVLGYTPLHTVAHSDRPETIATLRYHGCGLDAINKREQTPMVRSWLCPVCSAAFVSKTVPFLADIQEIAVEQNARSVVVELMKAKGGIDTSDPEEAPVDTKIIDDVVDSDSNVGSVDGKLKLGWRWRDALCADGNLDQKEESVHSKPLHAAALDGNVEVRFTAFPCGFIAFP